MKKCILFYFFFAVFFPAVFLVEGCKKDPIDSSNNAKPGKRNYVWTVDTLSYPGSFQTMMRAIWGTSASNVYAVGSNDQAGWGSMYRYDGTRWKDVRLSWTQGGPIRHGFDLAAIHGTSTADIYVAGTIIGYDPLTQRFSDSSLIIHFNGISWSEVQLPRRGRQLLAVYSASGDELFAGGLYGSFYRRSADGWQYEPTDTLFWFNAFANEGGQNYALAYYVPPLGGWGGKKFYLHWQAPHWQVIDTMSEQNSGAFGEYTLRNISGKLYSAGGSGVFLKEGSAWVRVLNSHPGPILGLYGTRDEHIFAVGLSATSTVSIYHFNGTDWYKYPEMSSPGTNASDVWCNEDEVFVVGDDGLKTFVYHGK